MRQTKRHHEKLWYMKKWFLKRILLVYHFTAGIWVINMVTVRLQSETCCFYGTLWINLALILQSSMYTMKIWIWKCGKTYNRQHNSYCHSSLITAPILSIHFRAIKLFNCYLCCFSFLSYCSTVCDQAIFVVKVEGMSEGGRTKILLVSVKTLLGGLGRCEQPSSSCNFSPGTELSQAC